jgi:hypothetical protein
MNTAEQQEELRHAVREVLAVRHPAALPLRSIRRLAGTALGREVSEAETDSALRFFCDLEQMVSVPDPLGATTYWRITASGVLAHERGR